MSRYLLPLTACTSNERILLKWDDDEGTHRDIALAIYMEYNGVLNFLGFGDYVSTWNDQARGGWGAYSFIACLSCWIIGHVSSKRRLIVPIGGSIAERGRGGDR